MRWTKYVALDYNSSDCFVHLEYPDVGAVSFVFIFGWKIRWHLSTWLVAEHVARCVMHVCPRLNLITGRCTTIFVPGSHYCALYVWPESWMVPVKPECVCSLCGVCRSFGSLRSMHLSWHFVVSFLYELCTHLEFIFVHCRYGWMSQSIAHCTRAPECVCVCVCSNRWDRKCGRALVSVSRYTWQTTNQHNGHGSENIEWPNEIECAVYVKSPWNNVAVFRSFRERSPSPSLTSPQIWTVAFVGPSVGHQTTLNSILMNKMAVRIHAATCKRPNN